MTAFSPQLPGATKGTQSICRMTSSFPTSSGGTCSMFCCSFLDASRNGFGRRFVELHIYGEILQVFLGWGASAFRIPEEPLTPKHTSLNTEEEPSKPKAETAKATSSSHLAPRKNSPRLPFTSFRYWASGLVQQNMQPKTGS